MVCYLLTMLFRMLGLKLVSQVKPCFARVASCFLYSDAVQYLQLQIVKTVQHTQRVAPKSSHIIFCQLQKKFDCKFLTVGKLFHLSAPFSLSFYQCSPLLMA